MRFETFFENVNTCAALHPRQMSDSADSDFISQSPNASSAKASNRFPAGTVSVSRIWSGAEWVAELEIQKGLKVQYR